METLLIYTIISGGQTGADRAGLDFAMDHQIHCMGWCPAGRKAEDGPIDTKYSLKETPSSKPEQRTEKNIVFADGTIIFYLSNMDQGTLLTRKLCLQYKKPLFVCSLLNKMDLKGILEWIRSNRIKTLNIAGPRESNDKGIYEATYRAMEAIFAS